MRCANRNKKTIYYCLYTGETEVYDSKGNLTGQKVPVYSGHEAMKANVSQATGQSNVEVFGNLENYDKVIVTGWMDCPIDESSVLFIDKEPEYSLDGNPLFDYIVRRVAKSINSVSIAVRKVQVS